MAYIDHIPSYPLNQYIYDLYYVDGKSLNQRIKVLPTPVLHLMINFGDTFRIYATDQAQPAIVESLGWLVGLWNQPYIVEYPSNVRFYGIHFKPSGAYPFLQHPLSDLHNQIVPLDVLWGRCAAGVSERLYEAPTIQAGFAMLEQLLFARLCEEVSGLDLVQYATKDIAQRRGVVSVRALSAQIGISQNHLATHFKRIVGATPKELARYYRFANVLQAIDPADSTDWTLMARQHHYYDLSHLNKDFVAFTGYNPSDYLDLRRRFYASHPAQSSNIGQLPFD